MSERDGDVVRVTQITYFRRDGAIVRVNSFTEGIGESYADPLLLVGLGRALYAGGRALIGGGRAALAAATAGGLPAISPAEHAALSAMFGSGARGAERLLAQVLSGELRALAPGVTRETVNLYMLRVLARGQQMQPVHQLRIQAMLLLLDRVGQ